MSVSIVPTLDMERAIAASGYDVIVGFDEVGRGSLARSRHGRRRRNPHVRPGRFVARCKCPTAWPIPKC